MPFEPKEILWKYKNSAGETFEKPEGKIIAPLLLSRDFPDKHRKFVDDMVKEGFTIAIPCDPETGKEQFRTDTYKFVEGAFFPLSPQEGASQLISAMKEGFDVVEPMGGACMLQKMLLVRNYFRENPDKIPTQRISFFGFSDGSTPALYLGELLQTVIASYSEEEPQRDEFFGALNWKKNKDGEDLFVEKKLVPLNYVATAKYNEATDFSGLKPINLFVHNQVLSQNINSCEEWEPKAGQKFILGVEGFSRNYGSSILEALENFLARSAQNGKLAQLQHIELGKIDAKDGDVEKKTEEAIIELCNRYEVPLVAREGQRTGHGKGGFVFSEPSGVSCELSFKDGKLVQKMPCIDSSKPEEIKNPRKGVSYGSLEPEFRVESELRPNLDPGSYDVEIRDNLEKAKAEVLGVPSFNISALPINESAKRLLDDRLRLSIIGGLPQNVTNMPIDSEKGLLFIVKSNSNHAFTLPCEYAFVSGRIKSEDFTRSRDVPFVIFAGDFEDKFKPGSENFVKFVDSNCRFLEKFVSLNEIQTPIFYVDEQIKGLPNLFEAQIEMTRQKPSNSVSEPYESNQKSIGNSAKL